MLKTILDLAPQQTFLVSGTTELFQSLVSEAQAIKIPLVISKAPQLTIDEATALAEFALTGGIEHSLGIFYFTSYSTGAAEVLLKALEEPHRTVTIIIVTPYPYTFPQTLRSRLRMITELHDYKPVTKAALKKIGEELSESKDDASLRREAALGFLDEIERFAAQEKNQILGKTVYDAKKYLLKANLPPKQVLEYILSIGF